MTKHTITPAHDDRVMVEIEIPRPGKRKSLTFKAARPDFQPVEILEAYAKDFAALGEWVEAKKEAAAHTGDDPAPDVPERPTVNGHIFEHPLHWWAYKLEMPDAEEIAKLTTGERDQIWEIWDGSALVKLGESSASSN